MSNTPSLDVLERLCAHLRMHMARECHEAADTIERLSAELERLQPVIDFLLGEKNLGGRWIGEDYEGVPRYWWRENLRAALTASPEAGGSGAFGTNV